LACGARSDGRLVKAAAFGDGCHQRKLAAVVHQIQLLEKTGQLNLMASNAAIIFGAGRVEYQPDGENR
jgi:hypothetical protein